MACPVTCFYCKTKCQSIVGHTFDALCCGLKHSHLPRVSHGVAVEKDKEPDTHD